MLLTSYLRPLCGRKIPHCSHTGGARACATPFRRAVGSTAWTASRRPLECGDKDGKAGRGTAFLAMHHEATFPLALDSRSSYTCSTLHKTLNDHFDKTMILNKVIFGPVPRGKRQEAEDAVESYISVLLHNGQASGEFFHTIQDGELSAYVLLAGSHALSRKYDSSYTPNRLGKIMGVFNQKPRWTVVDDEAPKRDTTWTKAPLLYLATDYCDWESPLCRGDNGKRIPLYRLPGTHEDREAIYFWQHSYRAHDAIWMGCGHLEIATYRQLAMPDSELSDSGREICRKVEKITGVPTYYFLMRYWGRKSGEEDRPCPGCGRPWRKAKPGAPPSRFCDFAFLCHACRLVSHMADSYDDSRHAVIGEWKDRKKQTKTSTVRLRRP